MDWGPMLPSHRPTGYTILSCLVQENFTLAQGIHKSVHFQSVSKFELQSELTLAPGPRHQRSQWWSCPLPPARSTDPLNQLLYQMSTRWCVASVYASPGESSPSPLYSEPVSGRVAMLWCPRQLLMTHLILRLGGVQCPGGWYAALFCFSEMGSGPSNKGALRLSL